MHPWKRNMESIYWLQFHAISAKTKLRFLASHVFWRPMSISVWKRVWNQEAAGGWATLKKRKTFHLGANQRQSETNEKKWRNKLRLLVTVKPLRNVINISIIYKKHLKIGHRKCAQQLWSWLSSVWACNKCGQQIRAFITLSYTRTADVLFLIIYVIYANFFPRNCISQPSINC